MWEVWDRVEFNAAFLSYNPQLSGMHFVIEKKRDGIVVKSWPDGNETVVPERFTSLLQPV